VIPIGYVLCDVMLIFLSAYFNTNVYVAMWNYEASFITALPIEGVIHGSEVPFLFGNPVDISTDLPASFTPAEKILSNKFISVVSHFMRHGNPGDEFPAWIPFSEEVNTVIDLDGFSVSDEISQIRDPPSCLPDVKSRCDLFDEAFEEENQGKWDRDKIVKNVALKASIWHYSPIIKAHSVKKTLNERAVRAIQQCPTCPNPPPCELLAWS